MRITVDLRPQSGPRKQRVVVTVTGWDWPVLKKLLDREELYRYPVTKDFLNGWFDMWTHVYDHPDHSPLAISEDYTLLDRTKISIRWREPTDG